VARRKIGFIVTGLVVWFGKGTVAPTLFMWTVFIHDLCMIAYAAFFLAHFVLSVMHPLMKGAINGCCLAGCRRSTSSISRQVLRESDFQVVLRKSVLTSLCSQTLTMQGFRVSLRWRSPAVMPGFS